MFACYGAGSPRCNSTATPARDYSKGDGTVCPLLARLLGPGGPFLDLQMVLLSALIFYSSHVDLTNLSRCDLDLGNRAALGLATRVSVVSGIVDGSHCPVLLELRDPSHSGCRLQPESCGCERGRTCLARARALLPSISCAPSRQMPDESP